MLKTIFIAASLGAICSFQLSAYAGAPPKTEAELRALKGKGIKAIFKNSPLPKQEQKHNPQIERAIEALKKKAEIGWGFQWDDAQTGIETLEGKIPRAKSSKTTDRPEKIATDFLKENHDLFQIRPDVADLHIERSIESMGSYYITLAQTFNGLPVFNGGVRISIGNKDKEIYLLHNYYVPDINISTTPGLSESDVMTIAKNDVLQNYMYTVDITGQHPYSGEVIYDKEPPRFKLGILNLKGTPVLIYKLNLFVSRPHKSLRYMINANTGEIIESGDSIMRAFGNGQIFNPNPVNTLNDPGLQSLSGFKSVDVPTTAYSTVKLNGITHTPRLGYSLKGSYVDVTDSIEVPYNFSSSSGYALSSKRNFIFNRTNDVFEHVMVYYHIDTNQRYVQTLGLGSIGNTSIRVDPHGGDGPYSSYYEADKNYIALGDFSIAGVDMAEDADIILHEYGHFIQTTQSNRSYDDVTGKTEKAAMSDGFADYWAASNTYDISIKNGFDPAIWGEWSIPAIYQRRVDNSTKHYPENIVHEAHADGEIWSSVLWGLFNTLGKTTADKIILKSHFEIPNNPDFRDGAEALLRADRLLFAEGQRHRDVICATLKVKGINAIGCGIKIVLTWDNPGADVDLHLRSSKDVNLSGWNNPNDCAYYNLNPDWGTLGDTEDNPKLSYDCIDCSEATETITSNTLTDRGDYRVLIHYYWDRGLGPSTATVEITEGSIITYKGSQTLYNTNDIWEPYRITLK